MSAARAQLQGHRFRQLLRLRNHGGAHERIVCCVHDEGGDLYVTEKAAAAAAGVVVHRVAKAVEGSRETLVEFSDGSTPQRRGHIQPSRRQTCGLFLRARQQGAQEGLPLVACAGAPAGAVGQAARDIKLFFTTMVPQVELFSFVLGVN